MSSIRRDIERRKRELCVPPFFPGSPDDYTYVPESCRKKTSAASTARVRRTRLMEQELAEVRGWLAANPMDPAPEALDAVDAISNVATARRALKKTAELSNAMLRAVQACFARVVDPAERRRQPSVLARMDQAMRQEAPEGLRRDARVAFKIRRGVLTMVEAHLRSALSR